jgi:hypothetical protein
MIFLSEVIMSKLVKIIFVYVVLSGFNLWSIPIYLSTHVVCIGITDKTSDLGKIITDSFSADEAYNLIKRDLETLVRYPDFYPQLSIWLTDSKAHELYLNYINFQVKCVLQNERSESLTEEEERQRTIAGYFEKEMLVGQSMSVLKYLCLYKDTGELIKMIKDNELQNYTRPVFYKEAAIAYSRLYESRENYIRELIDEGYRSVKAIYTIPIDPEKRVSVALLMAETGDKRCLKVLEDVVKKDPIYDDYPKICEFVMEHNEEISETVLAKALDYDCDVVKGWAFLKIGYLKIRSLYPKMKEIYNLALEFGRAKQDFISRVCRPGMFPYKIAHPYYHNQCVPVPDDAEIRDGF